MAAPAFARETVIVVIGVVGAAELFIYSYKAMKATYSRPPLSAWGGPDQSGGSTIAPNRLEPQMDINNARLRVQEAFRKGLKPNPDDVKYLQQNVPGFNLAALKKNTLQSQARAMFQKPLIPRF